MLLLLFFLLYSFSHRPEKLITTPPSAHTAQPSRKKTTRKNNNTICSICRNNRDERAFGTRRCKGDTGCSQDAAAAAVESLRASTKTCTQIIYNKYAKLVHMCVSVCVCVYLWKKGWIQASSKRPERQSTLQKEREGMSKGRERGR